MFSDGRPLGAFIKEKDGKEQHKDRRYSCNICQKYYSNETGYLKHMALHPEMVRYNTQEEGILYLSLAPYGSSQLWNQPLSQELLSAYIKMSYAKY